MAKAAKQNRDLCKGVTPEFRVSYPHVFKPNVIKKGDKPKYSIVMLFKKDTDMTVIKELIKQAKIAEFGPKENWPVDKKGKSTLESPVLDGDDEKYEDNEGYAGHWVVKATTNEEQKPTVVGPDLEPILDQTEFYPGCYARAAVFARVWEYMGKQGVQFILDHVQKTRAGKAFGGKKPADQVFSPIEANDDADDSNAEDDEDF